MLYGDRVPDEVIRSAGRGPRRQQTDDVGCHRTQTVSRDDITGKRDALSGGSHAEWIIDRRPEPAEIARLDHLRLRRRSDAICHVSRRGPLDSLIIHKKERLVLADWPAKSAAELVTFLERFGDPIEVVEKRIGVESAVAKKMIGPSMERSGARLGLYQCHRPGSAAVLGRVSVGH